jgi:prophage regulatory protein
MVEQLQTVFEKKHALIRRRDVERRTGLSRSSIYEKISRDEFPSPVRLGGGRAVAWVDAEVDGWIAEQIQKSRKTA